MMHARKGETQNNKGKTMRPQLNYKLRTLCELLEWFNSADSDNDMNPDWANSRSLYGKTRDTIREIVLYEFEVDIDQFGIDWGCEGSFYDTLVIYILRHADMTDWEVAKILRKAM